MKKSIRKFATPALLTLALVSAPAWAQSSMPASASSSSSTAPAKVSRAQRHADEVEQRITDLHTKLGITDAQSGQWNAFAQVMRDNATKMDQAFHDRAKNLSTMNAEEALKSYAAITQLQADNLQKLTSAFSDLYATFTPDQKATADTMYRYQTGKRHGSMQKKMSKPASASSSASPSGM